MLTFTGVVAPTQATDCDSSARFRHEDLTQSSLRFSRNLIFLSGTAIFGQMDRRSAGPRCGEPRP